MNSGRIEVSRRIRASASDLFWAWIDPDELALWWCREGPGWDFVSASVDPRVGGAFRLAMRGPSGRTHVAIGRYKEMVPDVRLVFSWDWEGDLDRMGETQVTVTFTTAGDSCTDIHIIHEGFAVQTERAGGHGDGWSELLNRMKTLKENSR